MKKKVYQDALVQVMDMIRWEFEDSDNEHVIENLNDIFKRNKIDKKMQKLFKEFEAIEKTI
tara:strand:- start:480 stop:662 length:183 start_codon:yes stop_codon:yes gene_type:complete